MRSTLKLAIVAVVAAVALRDAPVAAAAAAVSAASPVKRSEASPLVGSSLAHRRHNARFGAMRMHRRIRRTQRTNEADADDYGSGSSSSSSQQGRKEKKAVPENKDSQEGNIKAMQSFVKHLEAMNIDWQHSATDKLKQGSTPDEFPTFVGNDYHPSNGNFFAGDWQGHANPSASKAPSSTAQTNTYGDKPSSTPQPKKDDKPAPKAPETNADSQKDSSSDDDGDQYSRNQSKPPQQKKPTDSKEASPPQPSGGEHKASGGGGSEGGGGGGDWFSGAMTYFDIGLNACGFTDHEPEFIVAISQQYFNSFGDSNNSNNNPVCNRKIQIQKDGKTAEARVTDACPGCDYHDLDMSQALFSHFTDKTVGKTDMKWHFV